MALFDTFNSKVAGNLRLAKMISVPSTEDLKYALSEAERTQKPVELPFVNPLNSGAINFLIAASAAQGVMPPRWSFYRMEGETLVHLWSRQTTEVIMVQGRIKVESLYQHTGNTGQFMAISADDEPSCLSQRLSGEKLPAAVPPPSKPAASPDGAVAAKYSPEFRPDLLPEPVDNKALKPYDPFQSREKAHLPEPEQIDREAVRQVFARLSEPLCGMLTVDAFRLFLLSYCGPRVSNHPSIALVRMKALFSPNLSEEARDKLVQKTAKKISELSQPYEVTAYFGDGEFAFLRYGMDSSAAMNFADALRESLLLSVPELVALTYGVSSLPGTTSEPGVALAAAVKARQLAESCNMPGLIFPS